MSSSDLPSQTDTETVPEMESVFRRAQSDRDFRARVLSGFESSKRRCDLILGGAATLLVAVVLYRGLVHDRWGPNFLLVGVMFGIICFRIKSTTAIAALRAMEEKDPNRVGGGN